jgi:hypothetical protein
MSGNVFILRENITGNESVKDLFNRRWGNKKRLGMTNCREDANAMAQY